MQYKITVPVEAECIVEINNDTKEIELIEVLTDGEQEVKERLNSDGFEHDRNFITMYGEVYE